jgi:phospholipid transport system substrate-binding protein
MRFGLILLAALLLPLQLVFAATPQEDFINHLGQQAISVLADKSMTLDARHAAFAKMFNQNFDAGQQFSVHGSTPVDGPGSDVLVHSQIVQNEQGAPPVAVDWRVRSENGQNKIIDVMVEGVSMSLTQRNDFDGVVAQGGIDGLIKDLQARVSGEKPAALPVGQSPK